MAALSEEIRSVVACLSGQIDKGRVDAATAARARDILRDVADRVELIEDLIIPTSVTLPDVPRSGTNVVRLDPHRTRAVRPVGQPHHSPSTPAYLRYMDDFAVIGHDKAHLHQVRRDIEDFLHARLGLRCNHKTQIFPVAPSNGRALDFLGYRIWPTHRKIRKDSAGRMRRKMKRMARLYHEGKMTWDQVHQVIMSWIGHAGHANTYKLRTRVLCDVPFIPPPLEVQRRAK